VHHLDGVAIIGLNSALPTAPLLARGRLGAEQVARLEELLNAERRAGRRRIVLVHHPVADGVVNWRKALADRADLRRVLQRAGAELVLHGHARDSSVHSLPGAQGPIPCLCVPSSSAVPNPRDEGARWNRLTVAGDHVDVVVRRWSVAGDAFVEDRRFTLPLPGVRT
jgi:3',5'-cyclic AMP phosphodiesterase CpdA